MSAIKKIQKEIKWVSVGDIHCHPLNPRKNSKSAKIVAKSIQEYGYINPIVVDEEGTILAGNTRFKALQLLGVEEFDVLVVSGLTDEEKSSNKDAMKEIGITTLQDNKDELDKLIAGID